MEKEATGSLEKGYLAIGANVFVYITATWLKFDKSDFKKRVSKCTLW